LFKRISGREREIQALFYVPVLHYAAANANSQTAADRPTKMLKVQLFTFRYIFLPDCKEMTMHAKKKVNRMLE
jgi:hypothetical protein